MPLRKIALLVCLTAGPEALGQSVPSVLEPYPLSYQAGSVLGDLAAECDVLILGELHGSQEIPKVAAALLTPLTELGYGILALEIPCDEQGPLVDWATGKTSTVPSFFASPWSDGRGNIELLLLIRTALSPPFRWQLICFDEGLGSMTDALKGPQRKNNSAPPQPDDFIAISLKRDAEMAAILASEQGRLAPSAKVLAICGNMHARTANRAPADSLQSKLWPSFAAALQSSQPTWRVRSVNVVAQSGAVFAMMSENNKPPVGGVYELATKRQLDEAEARILVDKNWDLELDLPRATPATFLATPTMPELPKADSDPPKPTAADAPAEPRQRAPQKRFSRRTCRGH